MELDAQECVVSAITIKIQHLCTLQIFLVKIKVSDMKKLTKPDILSIKPGKSKAFVFETAKAVASARSYAYQLGYIEPPDGVKGYKTQANFREKTLIIEAVPC